MKKFILILGIGLGLSAAQTANAQVSIQVNVNIQPEWGPSGYDYAQFYYIPDLNCYYDIAKAKYIFYSSRRRLWYYTSQLPARYANFDLYNHYKVVVNRARPYELNSQHKAQYVQYKGAGHQQTLNREHRGSNNNNTPAQNNNTSRPQQNNNRPSGNNNGSSQNRPSGQQNNNNSHNNSGNGNRNEGNNNRNGQNQNTNNRGGSNNGGHNRN